MKIRAALTFLLSGCLLVSSFSRALALPAMTYVVYGDGLAAGWDNWSWATVNLAAASPVHSGSHSIAVTFGGWTGLYLHNANPNTFGATHLRFFVHGGGVGGQQMNLFLNLVINGQNTNGPGFSVPTPPANAWEDVQTPLSTLNPTGAPVTGITWQDATGGSQPTLYIDDISFTSFDSPNAPLLTQGSLFPRSVPADGATTLLVKVSVADPQGAADIASVTLDATRLGRGVVMLKDDGRSNDGAANDGVFGVVLTIAAGTPPGEQELGITAQDHEGNTASLPLGVLTVLGAPGGSIPASLPQRIGWGTNAWSDTPGQDWQVNSGVAWDYVYQYITYGWESWGSNFVSRFVNHAWDNHFIPLVTVYNMLATPPASGEGGVPYAAKLQSASTVQLYLTSLRNAAQEAKGSHPVIFVIEPDFFGFMQQLSNDPANRPPGVKPNDPSSYPVALNISGYPNTLAGFGHYLVDMIHAEAPNVLVAPEASFWAMNTSLWSLTHAEAIQNGQATAQFILDAVGNNADMLVVEWGDRDSGYDPTHAPFWDITDQVEPRATRAILWENALSRQAGKRLILWQMPVGNMALDNLSCYHYQDNRAAYAFAHPRDLFDAGIVGVVFGGGQGCSTQVWTDGGAVQAQGAIAYAAPAAPTGFTASLPTGMGVSLTWNENTEPDLWGYRMVYQRATGGPVYLLDVRRRSSSELMLPFSGSWKIGVAAYDAMGNVSPLSTQVTVDVTGNPYFTYLAVVKH
jgi:hypothetical protein